MKKEAPLKNKLGRPSLVFGSLALLAFSLTAPAEVHFTATDDGTNILAEEPGNTLSITTNQFQIIDTDPPSPRSFHGFDAEYLAP